MQYLIITMEIFVKMQEQYLELKRRKNFKFSIFT